MLDRVWVWEVTAMDVSLEATVGPIVEDVLNRFHVPGMVVAAAWGQRPPEYFVIGTDAVGHSLAAESLFPVASITKLATALAVLRLVDAGLLHLDDPLAHYLPHAAAAQPGITLHTLLTHTSGLPNEPHAPRESLAADEATPWSQIVRACLETPLERPPRTRVAYSNTGYGLLGIVIERQTGQDIATAIQTLVCDPLEIEAYLGSEPARVRAMIAPYTPTREEWWNAPATLPCPWGCLLTTAPGVLRLIEAFDGQPPGFLRPTTVIQATRNQVGDLGGGFIGWLEWQPAPWGLGPELRGTKMPHSTPAAASPGSFGHGGFAGSLVWSDPAADVAWVIMGTRTIENGWLLEGGPRIGDAILSAGQG